MALWAGGFTWGSAGSFVVRRACCGWFCFFSACSSVLVDAWAGLSGWVEFVHQPSNYYQPVLLLLPVIAMSPPLSLPLPSSLLSLSLSLRLRLRLIPSSLKEKQAHTHACTDKEKEETERLGKTRRQHSSAGVCGCLRVCVQEGEDCAQLTRQEPFPPCHCLTSQLAWLPSLFPHQRQLQPPPINIGAPSAATCFFPVFTRCSSFSLQTTPRHRAVS